MTPLSLIIILLVVLLIISFVSGVEAAYFSASRLSIELKKKQGRYSGKVWSENFHTPARFVATSIIVFNLLLVVYGYLWWEALGTVWTYWNIENIYLQLLCAIFASSASLLIVEFIFRAIFHSRSTALLGNNFITVLITGLFAPFQWLASKLSSLSEWILKYILNVKLSANIKAFSKPDIEVFIQQLNSNEYGDNTDKSNEIFENILSLTETKVKACMVPRREIIGVKDKISIDELARVFGQTKLSKLIVYQETIDNITGYVHQLDLFKNPKDIQSILYPIPVVPESMNATDLINKFSKDRKSIAWVIDEFGGTSGIVTMEDLLEQIFGEINDEFDVTNEFVEKKISMNEYLFSGRLTLNELTEKYDLHFKKVDEVETLSGYIINQNGGIPPVRARIIIDDYQFDIVTVAKTRIEVVRLKILR